MNIRIENLSKRFGDHTLFDRISFTIPQHQTTVLTGRSGCGKTTLLRIIAGLDRDFSGVISGVPAKISFMFQEDRLLPWHNVTRNIEFVLADMMDKPRMDDTIREMIAAVQLSGHEDKLPETLSGGMKRRAAMARALCYPADLLLLDEPFRGLDTQLKREMISLFERLFVKTGHTVIIVTHDEAVIERLGCPVLNIGNTRPKAP